MSGGGGGLILIPFLVENMNLPTEDKHKLEDISRRCIVRCSVLDAMTIVAIIWRILRA